MALRQHNTHLSILIRKTCSNNFQQFFNNDKNSDKISKVKGEIDEAKNVMVKNIGIYILYFSNSFADKVLERGER